LVLLNAPQPHRAQYPTLETDTATLERPTYAPQRAQAAADAPEPSLAASPGPKPALAAGARLLDRETGGQFILGQNYPNPYVDETTVPFFLTNGGDVRLDLFDLAGRKVAGITRKNMSAGEHTIPLNLGGLGLRPGDYLYQLQVTNARGVYRQSKLMTAG
jgi:hypothetical protein